MMNNLTGFQRDLLYVIAGLDEPYGLAVKEEVEAYYNQETNPGQLYPNLDDLVDEGLVDKGSLDRRTNSYSLTEKGHRALKNRHDWARDQIMSTTRGSL